MLKFNPDKITTLEQQVQQAQHQQQAIQERQTPPTAEPLVPPQAQIQPQATTAPTLPKQEQGAEYDFLSIAEHSLNELIATLQGKETGVKDYLEQLEQVNQSLTQSLQQANEQLNNYQALKANEKERLEQNNELNNLLTAVMNEYELLMRTITTANERYNTATAKAESLAQQLEKAITDYNRVKEIYMLAEQEQSKQATAYKQAKMNLEQAASNHRTAMQGYNQAYRQYQELIDKLGSLESEYETAKAYHEQQANNYRQATINLERATTNYNNAVNMLNG